MHFAPEYASTRKMDVDLGATFVYPDRNNALQALRGAQRTRPPHALFWAWMRPLCVSGGGGIFSDVSGLSFRECLKGRGGGRGGLGIPLSLQLSPDLLEGGPHGGFPAPGASGVLGIQNTAVAGQEIFLEAPSVAAFQFAPEQVPSQGGDGEIEALLGDDDPLFLRLAGAQEQFLPAMKVELRMVVGNALDEGKMHDGKMEVHPCQEGGRDHVLLVVLLGEQNPIRPQGRMGFPPKGTVAIFQ